LLATYLLSLGESWLLPCWPAMGLSDLAPSRPVETEGFY